MIIHRSLVILLVALGPGACSTLRTRQLEPPSDSVKIDRVTTSGNGCLQGSLPFNVNNADQTVTFQRLTEFHVSTGPSRPAAERIKTCAFHIEITYPRGWQFLLQQSSYRGYARLDKGVSGQFNAEYYLSSAPSELFIRKTDKAGDSFFVGTEFALDQYLINSPDMWSRCTGKDTAHFSNRLSVESTDPSNFSASGELWGNGATTHIVKTLWRRC